MLTFLSLGLGSYSAGTEGIRVWVAFICFFDDLLPYCRLFLELPVLALPDWPSNFLVCFPLPFVLFSRRYLPLFVSKLSIKFVVLSFVFHSESSFLCLKVPF